MLNLRDITDPGEFLPEPTPIWHTWWLWALLALGLILITTILYLTLCKPSSAKQHQTLLEKTHQQLDKLREQAPSLPTQTTITRLSLILRSYLETAFNDPALFETTEEFTLRPDALERLPQDSRQPVTDHLIAISNLKYSPAHTSDPILLINQTQEILAHIELRPTPAHNNNS